VDRDSSERQHSTPAGPAGVSAATPGGDVRKYGLGKPFDDNLCDDCQLQMRNESCLRFVTRLLGSKVRSLNRTCVAD
jgi:hypothetical protein